MYKTKLSEVKMKISKKILSTIIFTMGITTFSQEIENSISKEEADSYEVEEKKDNEEKQESNIITNALRSFKKKNREPVKIAESSLFKYNFMGTDVSIENVDFMLNPQNQEIGILYKDNHTLYFNEEAKAILKNAFEKYNNDFNSKVLITKKSKTISIYGTMNCSIILNNFLSETETEPKVKIGYLFIGKSPYFTLTIPESESRLKNPVESERNKKLPQFTLLFNKNQMRSFIDYFDYKIESN